ncbi:hypothetical protein AAFN85_06900 [Mucilaginibacter sp. CAU 1740]|uniref:hypothetical protein n=1 Tax=Mucilaginibacter sp. CAU 1740 TaxID=3140365 RepID=UPI00325A94BE
MYLRLFYIVIALFCICSCNNAPRKTDALNLKSKAANKKAPTDTVTKKPRPVFGYRFVISGDFDGDGKPEKLIERFHDGITDKETNKFYEADYDYSHNMAFKRKTHSFLECDKPSVNRLEINSGGSFGLLYLKNEGDLNGDGNDEVSYVTNNADWSSLNSYTILTYKHGKWNTLYWFPIWEWQLPPLPEAANAYGIAGIDQIVVIKSDTTNQRLLKELVAFKGLAKKISNKKLQIIYRSPEISEDTIIVNLKDRHPKL